MREAITLSFRNYDNYLEFLTSSITNQTNLKLFPKPSYLKKKKTFEQLIKQIL